MSKTFFIPALFLFFATSLLAQSKKQTAMTESSDPRAKVILDKVRKQYQQYKTLEMTFALTVEMPEQAKEIQKGKLQQKDRQYRLELKDQHIVSDGKSLWFYLKKNNEVQINDATSDVQGGILSPNDIFKIYDKKDYIYILAGEALENGKAVQFIEFKPTDRQSEFAKIRLTVEKKTSQMLGFKAFNKDGSRYTIAVERLTPNKALADATFTFNPKQYPNIHVEDLRID